jgi:hypothetical protein
MKITNKFHGQFCLKGPGLKPILIPQGGSHHFASESEFKKYKPVIDRMKGMLDLDMNPAKPAPAEAPKAMAPAAEQPKMEAPSPEAEAPKAKPGPKPKPKNEPAE